VIRDDAELAAARRHLSELEEGLAALRLQHLPGSPKTVELLSRGYRSEIADLTDTIHRYLGIPTCRLPDEADITLRIKGRDAELGQFSAAAIGDCLRHFENGICGIAAAQHGENEASASRARRACRFPLTGVGPGSVTLYLANPLPEKNQLPGFDEPVADRAIQALTDGIRWSSDMSRELGGPAMADATRNVLLFQVFKAVGELVPRHRGVDSVEVRLARRGDQVEPDVLDVSQETGSRARQWAKRIAAAGIRTMEAGVVRAIHLDNRTFQLRGRDGKTRPLPGTFPPSLFPVFVDLLDKRVKAVGILRSRSGKERFEVESVELA